MMSMLYQHITGPATANADNFGAEFYTDGVGRALLDCAATQRSAVDMFWVHCIRTVMSDANPNHSFADASERRACETKAKNNPSNAIHPI